MKIKNRDVCCDILGKEYGVVLCRGSFVIVSCRQLCEEKFELLSGQVKKDPRRSDVVFRFDDKSFEISAGGLKSSEE